MTTKNTTQKKRFREVRPICYGTGEDGPFLELEGGGRVYGFAGAAPELLAACQLYVRAKTDGGVSMADLSAKADEAIRAAIARATGDSQAEGGRL
jgi:hypothetical protein